MTSMLLLMPVAAAGRNGLTFDESLAGLLRALSWIVTSSKIAFESERGDFEAFDMPDPYPFFALACFVFTSRIGEIVFRGVSVFLTGALCVTFYLAELSIK